MYLKELSLHLILGEHYPMPMALADWKWLKILRASGLVEWCAPRSVTNQFIPRPGLDWVFGIDASREKKWETIIWMITKNLIVPFLSTLHTYLMHIWFSHDVNAALLLPSIRDRYSSDHEFMNSSNLPQYSGLMARMKTINNMSEARICNSGTNRRAWEMDPCTTKNKRFSNLR